MKLRIANFNKDFDEKRIVTNPKDYDRRSKKFTDDGIYSEKIFGNYQTDSLERAWVDFGDYYIINPILFNFLKKVIPKLNKIIKPEVSIDLDGNHVESTELSDIGLIKFKEDFDFYVDTYGNRDCKEWELIQKFRDQLFINKFPILSSKLRPGILINNVITSSKINTYYNFIIKYSNELKDSDIEVEGDININQLMFNLQNYVNLLVKNINDIFIKKKKGWLRNRVLGSRINYSARNVIGPLVLDDGLTLEDIAMPYKTYLELYKKLLINLLVKTKGINFIKANYIWWKASLKFDPEMYKLMVELNTKTKGGQWILLNRNPSINIGSILRLRIKIIKDDYHDDILQISNNILNSMNADYDGDVLNIVPLFNKHLVEAFKCFSPSKLMINSNDGRFNDDFSLEKEQKIGIYLLNNED